MGPSPVLLQGPLGVPSPAPRDPHRTQIPPQSPQDPNPPSGTQSGPWSCPKGPLRILHLRQGPSWDPRLGLWDPGPAQRDPQRLPILPERTLKDLGPIPKTLLRPWSCPRDLSLDLNFSPW